MNIRLNGNQVHGTTDKQKIFTGQKRTNIEIIADMLRAGEEGGGKIETLYTADMNHRQVQKYLEYLVSQGFINKVNLGNTVVAYQVTETGLKFLKAIDTLLEMIESTKNPEQQPE
jgi:predicted transcriptional regulator